MGRRRAGQLPPRSFRPLRIASGFAVGPAARVAAGFIFFLAVILGGCGDGAAPAAPDFKLETLDSERFYLNQQRGKATVLVFWTTWCVACKKELVALNELRAAYSEDRLAMAAVCCDPENADTVRSLARGLELEFPVLLDHGSRVFSEYGGRMYPTTAVIDQRGRFRLFKEGYDFAVLRQIKAAVGDLLDRRSE